MSNRLSPSSRSAAASLVATVVGEPTYSDPVVISSWNCLIVGRAHPRSCAAASSISVQYGNWMLTASSSVLATNPSECIPTGSGACPASSSAEGCPQSHRGQDALGNRCCPWILKLRRQSGWCRQQAQTLRVGFYRLGLERRTKALRSERLGLRQT